LCVGWCTLLTSKGLASSPYCSFCEKNLSSLF